MTRRAKGEGNIMFIPERNEYRGRLANGKDENGRTKYKYFYGGKGGKRSDLVRQMKEWQLGHQTNSTPSTVKAEEITLSAGIAVWLRTIKKPDLKRSSYDRLESIIIQHVNPRIGHYPIAKLTDTIIQEELINDIINDGFSLSTAKKAYDAVNGYLKYAQYKQFIAIHPMTMMKPPKAPSDGSVDLAPKEVEPLTDIEMAKFVHAAKLQYTTGAPRFPMGYAALFILNTGLRVGEAVAVTWNDIDFSTNTLSITKNLVRVKARDKDGKTTGGGVAILQDSPKTKKSRRTVPLNKAAIEIARYMQSCPGYDPDGFIIHSKYGKPISASSLDRCIEKICKAAGIRKISAHTLRHTFATKLFEKKVDVKIISEILGHTSTEVTYRIYIHVIEQLKREAIHTAFDILPTDTSA